LARLARDVLVLLMTVVVTVLELKHEAELFLVAFSTQAYYKPAGIIGTLSHH